MFTSIRQQAWLWIYQNPVISRDFILNLRKNRYFFLMALLLLVGTAGIALQWGWEYPVGTPIGRQLFFAYVGSELLVMLFILPGLVANSIIIERDRKILPMLLATPLGPGRILFGKTVSTAGLLLLLLVSTYPLITICMARGGVSPMELIGGCLMILYAGWAISAFALYNALRSVNTFRAVVATQFSIVFCYCILLPITSLFFFFASNIVAALLQVFLNWSSIEYARIISYLLSGFYSLLLIAIPLVVFWLSVKRMDYLDPRTRNKREMLHGIEFQFHQHAQKEKQERSYWEEGLGWNPFYIREYMGMLASRNPYSIPLWYFIAIVGHTFLWISIFNAGHYLGIAALIIMAQVVPSYTAGLFAGERENESWELLVTTSTSPATILLGKMMFALQQTYYRALGLYVIPVLVGALVHFFIQWARGEGVGSMIFFVECVLVFVHLTFMTTLITYISSKQQHLYLAFGFAYFVISSYLFGPLLLQPLVSGPWVDETMLSFLLNGLNPLLLLMRPLSDWNETIWMAWGFQILFYGVMTLVMVWLIIRELSLERRTRVYG